VAIAVAQDQEQYAQAINNPIFHVLVQRLGMDESHVTNITDILEHLVPRLLINIVMKFKTVYFDMPESMSKLLLQLQQRDIFARKQLEKLINLLVASETKRLL